MHSDFPAARIHLERALHYLRGSDETSGLAREAIDLLVEAIITAEFMHPAQRASLKLVTGG